MQIGSSNKDQQIWASSWQNQQNECTPSVFAVRMKKAWVLSYSLSTQRRLWLDWPDAQADLSLRWAHSHFVGFVTLRLIYILKRKHWSVGIQHIQCMFILNLLKSAWSWTVMSIFLKEAGGHKSNTIIKSIIITVRRCKWSNTTITSTTENKHYVVGTKTAHRGFCCAIWASSWDYGTYHIRDQRRLRRAGASAQFPRSLHCSHTWSIEVDKGSDQKSVI